MKLTPDEMQQYLPFFIDEEFPKGSKSRGHAIVHIALFLQWIKKHVKDTNEPV